MIKFPFTSFQQFNLDWIMQQLKKILDFMPLNGVPGDVLQRNVDGAAWMPISAVSMDIHGLNTIPDVDPADELPIYDNDQQGNYKVSVSDLMDKAPVQSVNGQTGDVVITAAVESVNGQTGTVVLDASDVGALPDTYAAPVDSVNGQTGTVVVNDVRYFYNYSNGYYSNLDDLAVTNIQVQLAHTQDKKCIEIHGSIEFTTGATSGWKTISMYQNSNLDVYDFVVPSSDCIRRGCILILDENDNIIPRVFGTIIIVRASGVIDIQYNQDATEPTNTKRTLLILAKEIQTAL